jgi:uncharacterized protein YbaP (TraB family)
MKKFVTIVFILTAALSLNAQLLWKVSGNDLQQPSYLFGTHHFISGDFIDSIPSLNEVINNIDEVFVEIQNDAMTNSEALQMMQMAMMAPTDSTLDKLYSPEGLKIIDNVVKKYFGIFGIGLDKFYPMKPAAIMMQLQVIQATTSIPDFNPMNLIDKAVEKRCTDKGKKANSLETVEFQTNLLFNAPLNKQASDLLEMCKADDKMETMAQELVNDYKSQNISRILEIMSDKELGGSDAQDLERLVFSRNRNWIPTIVEAMKQRSILVSVGCGHLPGPQGVITLLQQQGYSVTPVTSHE